jgi:hypothetical protein
MVVKHQNRL